MMKLILIHAAATLFMIGVIWFVQVVHYPMFNRVSPEVFVQYETDHQRFTSWVVIPPMVIELITAFLIWRRPPEGIPLNLAAIGFFMVVAIWLSTFLLQVPEHNRLMAGFQEAAHRRLVGTNWIRTVLWTLRGGIAVWMIHAVSRLLR
jgi:hypothetical protein